MTDDIESFKDAPPGHRFLLTDVDKTYPHLLLQKRVGTGRRELWETQHKETVFFSTFGDPIENAKRLLLRRHREIEKFRANLPETGF